MSKLDHIEKSVIDRQKILNNLNELFDRFHAARLFGLFLQFQLSGEMLSLNRILSSIEERRHQDDI